MNQSASASKTPSSPVKSPEVPQHREGKDGLWKVNKSVRQFDSLILMRQRSGDDHPDAKAQRSIMPYDDEIPRKISSEFQGKLSQPRVDHSPVDIRTQSHSHNVKFGPNAVMRNGIAIRMEEDFFSEFLFPVIFSCCLNGVEEKLQPVMIRKFCDNDAIRDCAAYLAKGKTEKVNFGKYKDSYKKDIGRIDLTVTDRTSGVCQRWKAKDYCSSSLNSGTESAVYKEVETLSAYIEKQDPEISNSLKILLGQGMLNQLYMCVFEWAGIELGSSGSSNYHHYLTLSAGNCVLRTVADYDQYTKASQVKKKIKPLKSPSSFTLIIELDRFRSSGSWRMHKVVIKLEFYDKVAELIGQGTKSTEASRWLKSDLEPLADNVGVKGFGGAMSKRWGSEDSLLSEIAKINGVGKGYFKEGFLLKDNKVFLCNARLSRDRARYQLKKFNCVSEYYKGLMEKGVFCNNSHAEMEAIVVRCSNLNRWYPSEQSQYFQNWIDRFKSLKDNVDYSNTLNHAVLTECRYLWATRFQECVNKYLSFNYQDYASQVFPKLSVECSGGDFIKMVNAIKKSQENTSSMVSFVKTLNDINQKLTEETSLSDYLCARYILRLGKMKVRGYSTVADYRGCSLPKGDPAGELVPYFNRFSTAGQKLISVLLYEIMNRLKVLCKAQWVDQSLTKLKKHNDPEKNAEFINELSTAMSAWLGEDKRQDRVLAIL